MLGYYDLSLWRQMAQRGATIQPGVVLKLIAEVERLQGLVPQGVVCPYCGKFTAPQPYHEKDDPECWPKVSPG